jgi:hypothetical protein
LDISQDNRPPLVFYILPYATNLEASVLKHNDLQVVDRTAYLSPWNRVTVKREERMYKIILHKKKRNDLVLSNRKYRASKAMWLSGALDVAGACQPALLPQTLVRLHF